MMAQQIAPNAQTRQENAWTNGNSTNSGPHVDAESFPSLDTPRENVSAKALQDETFGRDMNGGKQRSRRKSRRDQPRRDIKRVNGNEEGGLSSFNDNGGASETAAEPSSQHTDTNLQNGHMSHDNTSRLASNDSPRNSRFEHVFDDVPSHGDNGSYHHRQNHHNYKQFGRRQQNRRRYNRFDHQDRMHDSDTMSPRSGSNDDDEMSRRHNGPNSPDRYNRRRRDGRHYSDRDRRYHRSDRGWNDRRHNNYGRRPNYDHNRRHRNYEQNANDMDSNSLNGGNSSQSSSHANGGGGMNGMNGAGMGGGHPGYGAPMMGGSGPAGQFGQTPDLSPFPGVVSMNTPTPGFNYSMMGYPHQQLFPYQQAMQFPGSAPVMPMYTMPGQMVMFPAFPGVVPPTGTDIPGLGPQTAQLPGQPMGVTEISSDGMSNAFESGVSTEQVDSPSGGNDLQQVIASLSDGQGEVSDMNKLSEPTAEHLNGDANDQQGLEEEGPGDTPQTDGNPTNNGNGTSDQLQQQGGPTGFGDFPGQYPADVSSLMVQPPMIGFPGLWAGGYNPLMSVAPGGVLQQNADPTYTAHMKEQSAQVRVTDTGTHFPAHGDECEIPRGPYFCVKVACVATGPRHDERDVGQVVVVNFNCQVACNVYVKSEKPIVSYLDPLTSLAPGTFIQQYGLPLAEAKRIVKEVIPQNAVIVGQNVFQDLTYLEMKKGENYRASIDLRDLWHVWNEKYSNFTHFSLEHQARCILGHPEIEKHNAPLDANLTMQLFISYLEARAQKSGTQLHDMRGLLVRFKQEPSFSRRHPLFEDVCMGHRRYCKCGAPPLNAQGTPFLIRPRKPKSVGGTPMGSPKTPQSSIQVDEDEGTKDGDVPASAPAAVSTVFEPPAVVGEEGETPRGEANAEFVDSSLNVSE